MSLTDLVCYLFCYFSVSPPSLRCSLLSRFMPTHPAAKIASHLQCFNLFCEQTHELFTPQSDCMPNEAHCKEEAKKRGRRGSGAFNSDDNPCIVASTALYSGFIAKQNAARREVRYRGSKTGLSSLLPSHNRIPVSSCNVVTFSRSWSIM